MVGPWCHFCCSEKHQQATIPAAFPCWDDPTPAPRACCQALIESSLSSSSPSPPYLLLSVSATATRPLHPSLAGTGHVRLLLLPDVFVPPFQPLDHAHELLTVSTGDFGSSGEKQPSPSRKNLSVHFEREKFPLGNLICKTGLSPIPTIPN